MVTVLYVDWNRPDAFGFYHHRILNWLDLTGVEWEEQYFRIVEFLSNYRVWRIGIDTNGMGGPVAERLRLLMPNAEIVDLGSAQSEQSDRWKYLKQLIDRRQIVWPAGAKVRRTKIYKAFRLQMEDLQIQFKGPVRPSRGAPRKGRPRRLPRLAVDGHDPDQGPRRRG